MDPIICCLLGLCCPPEQRLERVTVAFMAWGVDRDPASKCAKGLIDLIDASPLGHFLKAVAQSVREHP